MQLSINAGVKCSSVSMFWSKSSELPQLRLSFKSFRSSAAKVSSSFRRPRTSVGWSGWWWGRAGVRPTGSRTRSCPRRSLRLGQDFAPSKIDTRWSKDDFLEALLFLWTNPHSLKSARHEKNVTFSWLALACLVGVSDHCRVHFFCPLLGALFRASWHKVIIISRVLLESPWPCP